MEIITIESSAFKELAGQIKEIAQHVKKMTMREERTNADEMLTTGEAARLLRISPRTLQRMRTHRIIGYTYAGNACRYRRSEIERYMNERHSDAENTSLYVPRIGKEVADGHV